VLQLMNPTGKNPRWVHHPSMHNGLEQSSFYGIAQSKDGKIWVGGAKLYNYSTSWALAKNDNFRQFVNVVANDKERNLYVGSRYYGLFVYDGKKWKQHNTENGLESNTIISVAVNARNQIYAVTDNDISYFDGTSWVTHIFPADMNMSSEGGNIQLTENGSVWINKSTREWKRRAFSYPNTSEDAYKNFRAYCYKADPNPPKTKITLYNKEVSKEGNATITWDGEDYLNRTPKSRLQFSYRLNGGKWSPFSNEKVHTFLGLESGEYTLEVRARDLDFNLDPTTAKVEFEVLTPIWKQIWFLSMIGGFIILFVILEIRIINKNKRLSHLNTSLQGVNQTLKVKNEQVEEQSNIILKNHIQLEEKNKQLENKTHEIESQRDALQEMVEKVEVLSNARVKFFTNITHEFRTPLTLIHGPVEKVFNEKVSGAEKEQLHQIIRRNITRLQNLINQLLDIRAIETGTLQLNLRKSDALNFVSDIKRQFNNLAEQREITLTFNTSVKTVEMAFDEDKMEKILLNLLNNAFKYTPSKGKINLNVCLDKSGDKEFLQIEVTDTGKGIEEGNLQQIFERYNSVSKKSNVSYYESTGIGLSHIKELIELHHGKILVESQLGKGSSFTVFIPTDLSENNPDIAHAPMKANQLIDLESDLSKNSSSYENTSEKKTVLVVEDNFDMKLFLKGILKERFNIIEAVNGLEAIEVCKNQDIDLILSDIMMPEMDGLTLCQRVKTNFETSHIPVILLTAKTKEEQKIEGYQHGADAYIEKPFNTKLLIIRIDKLLQDREKLRLKFSQDLNFRPKEIQVVSEDEKFLKKLAEVMEKNIAETDFDVDKMAEMLNKSHVQFIRKVKQLTGRKPVDLLKTFRLQRAKQLLEQEKISVSEISYMVGYDLPNSFTRAFKKEFGVSPSEYLERKEVAE
jgi:signal transduction histidine kinase/DNA-binding response OmpR family regulator